MHFQIILEHEIASETHELINQLLVKSFPGFPSERSYYKLLPQFRYLGWMNENLIAHAGIEHRVINNTGIPVRIFGLIDLCVDPRYRSRRIATKLLQQVDDLGHSSKIDFLILFADDHRLYTENGYCRVENLCRWMMVDEHQILGIAEKTLADCMMVKQIGARTWQDGTVDLLGYLF